MELSRRRLMRLATAAVALPALPHVARAQAYPSRPVRVIVGFAAGTGPDIVGRLAGEWLSERTGQQFIVEDRQGAASNIAVEAVAKSAADGYTLLQITPSNAINATLYSGINFIRDITPIASVARAPFALVVNSSFPAKTIPEFIAYAKANPGKINMGSSSTGTAPYMSGALFRIMADIDILSVPYRGTPQAITELLGGRLQVVVSDMSSIDYIKTGKLRALGVTTATSQDVLPGVPPIGEFLPGYEASTWYGLGGPSGTPPEIVAKINTTINDALKDPQNVAHLASLGFATFPGSPADFGKYIAGETEKWSKVISAAHIKPE